MPAAAALPNRPLRKGEATAERILDAAEVLFAERGFEGTTLRDVAGAVGLRNPSLYNHFDSKETLYAAVLERGIRPILEVLSEFITSGGGASSRELVVRIMELLTRHHHLPLLVQQEALAGGQRLSPMLREWIGPAFAHAHEMVEKHPAATRWPAEQIPHLVLAVYHAMLGYFATAPLYSALTGEDLLSNRALENQTAFLRELVEALLPEQNRKDP